MIEGRGGPPIDWPPVAANHLRLLGIGDGRSIIFLRWAWRLAERGHEVHVASDRLSDRPGELDGIVAHDVRELGLSTRIKGVRRLVWGPAVARLAHRLDVDVVHAHYLLPYGHWAAWADVHPLVISPWNTDIFTYGRDRARGRKLVRKAIAAGDAYVVSSVANAEETVRLGAPPGSVHRIVWYVDPRPFSPAKRVPGLAQRFGWPAGRRSCCRCETSGRTRTSTCSCGRSTACDASCRRPGWCSRRAAGGPGTRRRP